MKRNKMKQNEENKTIVWSMNVWIQINSNRELEKKKGNWTESCQNKIKQNKTKTYLGNVQFEMNGMWYKSAIWIHSILSVC